jgi:hypothetical protein
LTETKETRHEHGRRNQKQLMKTLFTLSALALGASASLAQSVVYDNSSTYSGWYLSPGSARVGDEIVLGGTARRAYEFRFEYYGANFNNNEQFRLQFYNNDGALLGGDTYLPGSIFYDGGWQTLGSPTDPSGRASYTISLDYADMMLPERFTWSIQFNGVEAGESAGVVLYNPPGVGSSFDDYWHNAGSGWELRGTNGVPVNFGASITAVPEPSTYVLAVLGGVCGLAMMQRRRRAS